MNLPDEMLRHTCEFLAPAGLGRLARASRGLRGAVRGSTAFRRLFKLERTLKQCAFCVAALPDGNIVTGHDMREGPLKVTDAATGASRTLGGTGVVRCVAVQADGRIFTDNNDGSIQVRDSATGGCLQTLQMGELHCVCCIALLQDGRLAVGFGDEHPPQIWDLTEGRCVKTLIGHRTSVYSLAELPRNRVVSGSRVHAQGLERGRRGSTARGCAGRKSRGLTGR
jgi:WD40 repeat protein